MSNHTTEVYSTEGSEISYTVPKTPNTDPVGPVIIALPNESGITSRVERNHIIE